jgi:Mrp family chromosome partitioning ATPase
VTAFQAENSTVDGPPNIPSPDVIAPEAAAFRQIRIQELNQVLTAKTELELTANAKANSEIVSQANEPGLPVNTDNTLLVLAGGVFGGVLGLAVAVLWAGLSSTVLDEQEAAEIIGQPLTASVQVRSISRSGVEKALTDVSSKYAGAVEGLAVRCEATGGLRDPLVICVVGSERGAGSTSLSVALAERFANVGARVVLVDGDGRYPELTHASNVASSLGIAELFTTTASGEPRPFADHLAPLNQRVSLLGLGGWSGEVGLRSSAVPRVLEAARSGGDVVIVDAGPLLDSASANQFVHESDVVVLTLPARGQKARDLSYVIRALDCAPERLLVVNTHVVGRRRAKLLGAGTATSPRPAPIEVVPVPTEEPVPTSDYQPTERSFSRWSRKADEPADTDGAPDSEAS